MSRIFVAKPRRTVCFRIIYLFFFLNVRGVLIYFCCFCLYFISLVLCAFEHSPMHINVDPNFLLNCNLILWYILHGVVCI